MSNAYEDKFAYPYITKFKKEPFSSFINVKRRDIRIFYYSEYNKIIQFYHHFNQSLINEPHLNLENVFWLLLLRKYLKEEKKKYRDKIFAFIKSCEVQKNDQIGFTYTPHSENNPDICSTFFALSSLKTLGLLNQYLMSDGRSQVKEQIKNFVLAHKKGNKFLHCQNKECEICKNSSNSKLLYYIIEIFTILGVDVRVNREQFRTYADEKKKDSSLIFRLLCFKYLDLDMEVKDKELQLLQQLQKENGSFSFTQGDNIDITFWLVYILELYSWLLDYNPAGIYSFITQKLKEILKTPENWNPELLNETSKLIILLSLVWKKFIEEIERVLFRQLEKEKYVDINQLKSTFGLVEYIDELVLYINLNYNFKLQIIDNEIEFQNFISNFSYGKKEFFKIFYNKLNNNSIISLSELFKKFKAEHLEPLKLKEDIFPIVKDMVKKKLFIGTIRTKKSFLGFRTKYLFYLKYFLKKIIICDVDLNTERLFEEKEKLDDIKNDIYNMTLKLKNISSQIREEIESYLLINEISYAKERLKFILRDALMEADFLNENIEGSFNEILKYINIQASLGSEISQWKKEYSILQKKLVEVESYLKGKIQEKEELRNLASLLETLNEKIDIIEEDLIKKVDLFKKQFTEVLEKDYDKEELNCIIQSLDQLSQNVRKYDQIIYGVSQQITIKEKKIIKKHKKIIEKWINIKEQFNTEFDFYTDGFQFFNNNLQKIEGINKKIKADIIEIGDKAKRKIKANEFQDAFNFTKTEYDLLMKEKLAEIKEIQSIVKREVRKKQKIYLLCRHLQEKLEELEAEVIELIANQVKTLKNFIIEERNKSKIEDFDNFVSQEIANLKSHLKIIKTNFDQSKNLKIDQVNKELDNIHSQLTKSNKLYLKKLNECVRNIENFKEQSELSIIQWENFIDSYNNDISVLKDEYINKIISNRVNIIAIEKKTNYIKLDDLKKEVKLSCKILINRLKDMIDISKINAELNEEDKIILLYTDYYYLNKDLKSFVDNHLLKLNRERIGKILALYDSSIRNRTLNVNMLELQNRIKELSIFDDSLPNKFYKKANDLNIIQEREEFLKTKNHFESTLENDRMAINNIKSSIKIFNKMQVYIEKQFNMFNMELREFSNKNFKRMEGYDNYGKIQDAFETEKLSIKENFKKVQDKIEEQIKIVLNATGDPNKLIPEIRELYVFVKNTYIKDFENKVQKINDQINSLKNESFREQLLKLINDYKIHLSQLLGNLERKVEDNIEIKEFKKSNYLIQKRAKNIELEIKEVKRYIDNTFKDFSRKSKNFTQISKFILDDFNKFIEEYSEILNEKVKALERLILKSYIRMTIKAVANEYLTVGFLNNELKIKKQNIQDHLLFLISSGELQGKFDPRISIYFENPEVLDELDETELEVIKSTNYKVNMMLRHLKNLASQYGSVIALFASIITISYYFYLFSGNNPVIIALPIVLTVLVMVFYVLKKNKEETIN